MIECLTLPSYAPETNEAWVALSKVQNIAPLVLHEATMSG